MKEVLESINNRLTTVDAMISKINSSHPNFDGERLLLSKIRGRVYYYLWNNENHKRTYLGKDKIQTVKTLAQKLYEERLLKTALREKELLKVCYKMLSSEMKGIDSVFSSMANEIKPFIKPEINTNEGFAEQWLSQSFYQAKKTEHHKFETLRGDHVRSKSELIIADRLFSSGVPYRYEQRLDLVSVLEMHRYYPDFTILKKQTNEIIYWEHLGKLDDPNYCKENIEKLEVYSRFGMIQGKNLILTYECTDKALSTSMVNKMIEEFLK